MLYSDPRRLLQVAPAPLAVGPTAAALTLHQHRFLVLLLRDLKVLMQLLRLALGVLYKGLLQFALLKYATLHRDLLLQWSQKHLSRS